MWHNLLICQRLTHFRRSVIASLAPPFLIPRHSPIWVSLVSDLGVLPLLSATDERPPRQAYEVNGMSVVIPRTEPKKSRPPCIFWHKGANQYVSKIG